MRSEIILAGLDVSDWLLPLPSAMLALLLLLGMFKLSQESAQSSSAIERKKTRKGKIADHLAGLAASSEKKYI